MSTTVTSWRLYSSKEKAASIFLSAGYGELYARDDSGADPDLTIYYRFVGLGVGKGPPVSVSWSDTSDPSNGVGNIVARSGYYFGRHMFPCRGYILGFGGSASVLPRIFGTSQSAGSVNVVLFGFPEWHCGGRMWSTGTSLLPGGGAQGYLATFQDVPW
ncbi:MAG: hypothetical protein U0167_08935 [bacterium]